MNRDEAFGVACEWAKAGIPAFSVAISWDNEKRRTNKRPLTDHGFHDATVELAQLERMFADAPERLRPGEELGVGLRPGPTGLMGFDIDVNNGDELERVDELGIPRGVVVTTPSGGEHRIVRKRTPIEIGNTFSPTVR